VTIDTVLTAAVGAFFGAAGWLLVGLYMSRRQTERQSRNAARAVYFELSMNAIDVDVAEQHFVFQPLRRASFDALLPELATWLHADELETIVKAYMAHAGYEQAQRDDQLPVPIRKAVLHKVLDQHHQAMDLLRRKSFSPSEAARLSAALAASTPGGEASPVAVSARNA
jgi:hypothetical protein